MSIKSQINPLINIDFVDLEKLELFDKGLF